MNTNIAPQVDLETRIYQMADSEKKQNIARGTTDPEIDSETWTKLGNNMATCTNCKFGHQMAPLDLFSLD